MSRSATSSSSNELCGKRTSALGRQLWLPAGRCGVGSSAAAAHGAVLVLGGAGTLGSLMVRWLAEAGVACIPVASRSGRLTAHLGPMLSAGASAAHAAAVTLLSADGGAAGDAAALDACLGGRPLLGVLHAGGVLADATFANQSAGGVRKVGAGAMLAASQALVYARCHLRCHHATQTYEQ